MGRKEIEAEAVDALICLQVRRNDYLVFSACIGAQHGVIAASFLEAMGQDTFKPGFKDISLSRAWNHILQRLLLN